MARGINTKCLHLEEEEGCCNNYGSISYPIYQTATYAHHGSRTEAQALTTADCRIQPESTWKRWWHLWRMALMHWPFLQEWQQSPW